jgi:polyphosphate kinase 2 (PPK2 family)
MSQVNDFERMLVQSNIILIKLYFSITKEKQAARFEEIKSNPLKRWKMTPTDEKAQELWEKYTAYKKSMFARTNSTFAPWFIIDANNKPNARLTAIMQILDLTPYH